MQIFHDNIELDRMFPFSIEYMLLEPRSGMGHMHWHDCFEISCVTQGAGVYSFEERDYPVTAGDTVVINNVEPHRLQVGPEPFGQLVVVFHPSLVWTGGNMIDHSYLDPFSDHGQGFNNLIPHGSPLSDAIQTLIPEIYDEYTERGEGWQLMIKAKLLALLTLLYRHYRRERQGNRRRDLLRLSGVFAYLESRFPEPVSLREAAALLHFSPQYFSAFFSGCTGIGFTEYVIRMRIDRAVLLLRTTDDKITAVAQQCGFNNIGHFNEIFRKYTGMRPSDFRRVRETGAQNSEPGAGMPNLP